MDQTMLWSAKMETESVQLQTERPDLPVEKMEQEHAPPQKKRKARKKRPRYYTAVRRSTRIQNIVKPSQNRDLEPIQITLSESESESDKEEEPAVHGEKTLVERVEYSVQLLETMSSQGNNRPCNSSEIRYKSLYFESQKQIEALKKENHELSLKLQLALAKNEGFEKGSNASVEWMGLFKEVLLVSVLPKPSEMATAVQCQDPKAASSSKRKR